RHVVLTRDERHRIDGVPFGCDQQAAVQDHSSHGFSGTVSSARTSRRSSAHSGSTGRLRRNSSTAAPLGLCGTGLITATRLPLRTTSIVSPPRSTRVSTSEKFRATSVAVISVATIVVTTSDYRSRGRRRQL